MHKRTGLALLAACLLLLAGCGTEREAVDEKTITAAQSSVPEADLTSLRQLSRDGDLWQLDGTTMYTTVTAQQGRGEILQTVDLNTGKRQAFCSKPGCAHQDESCGAWLDCESGVEVLPMEDGRLVLVYGRYGPLEEQGAEPSAAVELRDTSGAVVCPATPLPNRPASTFYTDGIAVYYLWEQWQEDGSVNVSLIRVELDAAKGFGQASTAAFWQLPATLSLTERCTEQGMIAIRWEHRMEGQTQVVQHRELCLVQWDGTVRTVAEAKGGQSFLVTDMGETETFCFDSTTGTMARLDLATGETEPFARLPEGLQLTEGSACVGDVLICNFIQDGEAKPFYMEKGGDSVEIRRQTSHNGYLRPAMVLDVLEDGRLIVDLGDLEYEESYTDQTGQRITSRTSETLLGVCTPEQYREGAADCLTLETNHKF